VHIKYNASGLKFYWLAGSGGPICITMLNFSKSVNPLQSYCDAVLKLYTDRHTYTQIADGIITALRQLISADMVPISLIGADKDPIHRCIN